MTSTAIKRSLAQVLRALGNVARGAIIWCTVGVGIAALISSLVLFVWAIFVVTVAAPIAALLGSVQGLWLYLERLHWKNSRERVRFGWMSGAALGLLGFAPSYIHIEVLPSHGWLDIAIFLAAALFGGMAAGGVTALLTPTSDCPQAASRSARRVLVGSLLILAGALIEYSVYWPALVRKLPILRLDESSVVNLPDGNARGSLWSGCFQYNGETFWASGMVGSEGGAAFVQQKDGALQVSLGDSAGRLSGGVDEDGRFWAGAQAPVGHGETLRTLLRGRFLDKDHIEYSLRRSYLKGTAFQNTTRVDGKGSRCR
jgi:hypothetical protein